MTADTSVSLASRAFRPSTVAFLVGQKNFQDVSEAYHKGASRSIGVRMYLPYGVYDTPRTQGHGAIFWSGQ